MFSRNLLRSEPIEFDQYICVLCYLVWFVVSVAIHDAEIAAHKLIANNNWLDEILLREIKASQNIIWSSLQWESSSRVVLRCSIYSNWTHHCLSIKIRGRNESRYTKPIRISCFNKHWRTRQADSLTPEMIMSNAHGYSNLVGFVVVAG